MKVHHLHRNARAAARGFGLIELMVSLTLGLLVVGAAIMLLLSARQTNGSTDNLSRVQESVRTSYDLMTRELREAGGTPCDSALLTSNVLSNAQGATPDWWATWGEAVRGFGGTDAFAGAAFGTAVGQRVSGTGAISLRYGVALDNIDVVSHNTGTKTFTANVANHGLAVGDLMMVCNYRQASIFQVTAVNLSSGTFTHATGSGTPGNCGGGLGLPVLCTATGSTYQFTAGSMLARFNASGWYIGNNGRPETGGRSLYRVTRLGPEEVADGVRDMTLTYLVNGATDYVAASAVSDWSTVISVRMELTFETADVQASVTASAASARLRRTVAFTMNLRNLQS